MDAIKVALAKNLVILKSRPVVEVVDARKEPPTTTKHQTYKLV